MKSVAWFVFCCFMFAALSASAQEEMPSRYELAGVVKTFATGKAAPPLTAEAKGVLDQVAQAARERTCLAVRLVGTADVQEFRSQHELQNSNLADRRCNAVKNELMRRGMRHLHINCAPSMYDTQLNDRSVTVFWDFDRCIQSGMYQDIEALKEAVIGHDTRLNKIDGSGGRLDQVERRVTALERRPTPASRGLEFAPIEGGVGLGFTGIGGGEQSLFFLSAEITIEWNITQTFGVYGAFLTGVGSADTVPESDPEASAGYYFGGGYGVYLRGEGSKRFFVGGQHLGISTHHPGYTDFWLHAAVLGYEHVFGDDGADDHLAFFLRAEGFVGNAVPTKSEAFVAGGGSLILGGHF